MSDSKKIYEVKESGGETKFYSREAFKLSYSDIFDVLEEWDGTYLEVANYKNGGIMVKSHPSDLVKEDDLIEKEDLW
jgi:hypothetical protein